MTFERIFKCVVMASLGMILIVLCAIYTRMPSVQHFPTHGELIEARKSGDPAKIRAGIAARPSIPDVEIDRSTPVEVHLNK